MSRVLDVPCSAGSSAVRVVRASWRRNTAIRNASGTASRAAPATTYSASIVGSGASSAWASGISAPTDAATIAAMEFAVFSFRSTGRARCRRRTQPAM